MIIVIIIIMIMIIIIILISIMFILIMNTYIYIYIYIERERERERERYTHIIGNERELTTTKSLLSRCGKRLYYYGSFAWFPSQDTLDISSYPLAPSPISGMGGQGPVVPKMAAGRGALPGADPPPCPVHPVSVRRFPSFRTQPLENLSHYL